MKPADSIMEDALTVSLLYALRKQTAQVARNAQKLAEKLGESLVEIKRLESELAAAKNESTLHFLARRKETSDFYASPVNIREFQVKQLGPTLYRLTLDDPVGESFQDIRLLAIYAHGDGDILGEPDAFNFADPVRRLFWNRRRGGWEAQPLKSVLRGDGENLHDLFVDTDWGPKPIVGPYPFDPSLKIKVLANDFWEIRDASGGVVVERDGKLVYKKGDKTISIAIEAMCKAGGDDFGISSHDLVVQKEEQDETGEGEATCVSCDGAKPVCNGMCSACAESIFAAFTARKAQLEADEAAEKEAAEKRKAMKRGASSDAEDQTKQKKQKTQEQQEKHESEDEGAPTVADSDGDSDGEETDPSGEDDSQ